MANAFCHCLEGSRDEVPQHYKTKKKKKMNEREALPLTGRVAVNTEVVALCVADGLQNYCFTLAVFASLQ